MEIEVYAEQVLLDNFLADFALLWCTKRLLHSNAPVWRMLLAAVLGAFTALLAPLLSAGAFFYQTAVLLVICFIAYWQANAKSFFRHTLYFLILSFIAAGLAIIISVFASGLSPSPISFYTSGTVARSVIVCIFCMLAAGYKLPALISKLNIEKNMQVTVNITTAKGSKSINALVDTGHNLTEPLTGLPVIILNHADIANLLDPDLALALKGEMNNCKERIYCIPYTCVGKSGVLFGFKPKAVSIVNKDKEITCQCIVAIGNNIAAAQSRALLNPMLLHGQ